MTITIKKGDSDTLTETITGITSLAGYSAKMYIYNAAGALAKTLTGTVGTLTITYEIVNEQSKTMRVGSYTYESKIFDSSDHVYTTSSGSFIIAAASNSDPS